MKYCIVNADDFGMSHGVNRGIIEAHQAGVVTSTSLMVTMPASGEAALLTRQTPELSVGLHVDFTGESPDPAAALSARTIHYADLELQLLRFRELLGCLPTHIDSHQNVHRYPQLLPLFQDLANRYGLPLREYSRARYFPDFYGQWDGETHLEQVSPGSLLQMLETEFHEGITELSCHPGHIDADFHSFYAREREEELRTLCNPFIRDKLSELGIKLISFRELLACP
jgi:chitin disaccharide deacetylase